MENENNNDYSLIFDKIEEYITENPSYNDSGVNEEDLQNDDTIRAFAEICREINSASNNPQVYLTFS